MKLLVLALAGSLAFAQIPKGGGGSGGGGGGTGSANISTPFAAVTSVAITVTGAAATSLTDCYDNASPPVLIVTGFTVAVTNANTVTASWTGSKTGTCITNTSGINGIAGAAGASGPSGPSGPSGATGVTGSNGASGPSGPSGPTGVTGASGPSGPSGPSGASGPSGPQGTAGTNGTNGANGTGNNALCSDATGSGTTYTCPTPTPAISTLSGLLITFIPQTTNSGSATVNVSSLGAKTLKQSDCSTNLSASALTGGSAYLFSYNGTSFCQSAGAGAGGGVTSVATTGPITGGTITTTGTIACATCTTNASALTSNQLVFGAGSQATAVGDLTGDITTAGAKATTLATVNANTGSFGDGTHVGAFTVNGKGLITAASSVAITAGTGNAAGNVTTTFSATPTFTCGSSSAGTTTLFSLSTALTANITSSTLATCTAGQTVAFHFVQDATGGRTVAMPTNWDALTVDGTASTATDALYAYDGTNGRLVSVNGKATPFLLGQAPERAAPTTATSCGSTLGCFWFDSTNHIPSFKDNNSGTVSSTVVPNAGSASNFVTAISASGVVSLAQPAVTDISGFGTGVATFLATPSSANLASAVTNETGSSLLVFNTSPTLVTPLLGTPTSGTLTNTSGYLWANLASPPFVTNAKTATYQVLAADFTQCKTIPVASGTFTITLVASGTQPADGQCLYILNYGTGVVTLARSGQNINGAAANLTGTAGSATAPTGWKVTSNGTDYVAEVIGGGGAGGGVTSVTFTGDGVFDSSTPSGAVTTTGSVTATAKTQVINTVAVGPSDTPGGAAAAPTFTAAPTPLYFTDPRSWVYMSDEFVCGAINSSNNEGCLQWTVSSSAACTTSSDTSGLAGTYGVQILTTAIVSGNDCRLRLGNGSAFIFNYGTTAKGDIIYRASISATTTVSFLAGWVNPNSGAGEGTSDYFGIAYDTAQSDTNWMCVAKTGGTATRTSTGVAASTGFHDFRIRFTSAAHISCSVDGGSETAVSTNFPTGSTGTPEISIFTRTTAARVLDLDYFFHAIALAR